MGREPLPKVSNVSMRDEQSYSRMTAMTRGDSREVASSGVVVTLVNSTVLPTMPMTVVTVVVMPVIPIGMVVICITRIVAVVGLVVGWNTKAKGHMHSSLGLIRYPGNQTERDER